jgi:hypothetical protein
LDRLDSQSVSAVMVRQEALVHVRPPPAEPRRLISIQGDVGDGSQAFEA